MLKAEAGEFSLGTRLAQPFAVSHVLKALRAAVVAPSAPAVHAECRVTSRAWRSRIVCCPATQSVHSAYVGYAVRNNEETLIAFGRAANFGQIIKVICWISGIAACCKTWVVRNV